MARGDRSEIPGRVLPRLVLLPELGDGPEIWDVVPLDRRFDVIAVDTTALARETAGRTGVTAAEVSDGVMLALRTVVDRALAELPQREGPEVPPVLVGHGWGAQLALAWAGRFAASAVVIVDEVLDFASRLEQLSDVDAVQRAAHVIPATSAELPDATRRLRDAARSDETEVLALTHAWLLSDDAELDAAEDAADRLCSVPAGVPVLAIHGIDPGPGYSMWLRLRIPAAVIEVWPYGGHDPHLAEPVLFVRRLALLAAELGPTTT